MSNKNIITAIFSEQALQHPENIAVVFENKILTYKQLDDLSNQLANFLVKKGVTKETLVPICVNRSIEMVIGILGVIKAGGAYVPIDPEYPQERIDYILNDIQSQFILSNIQSRKNLYGEVILLDDESLFTNESTAAPDVTISDDQLCYIIYTSGSTGRPKGVMLEHRNLLNYLYACKDQYIDESTSSAGSYFYMTYTFDASITALFLPLISGKSIVISSLNAINVFEDKALQENAPYDFIKITPAHLSLFDNKYGVNKFLTNRLVIGGEELKPKSLEYLSDNPDLIVINEYGPTECTVGCSIYSFAIKDVATDKISIGKPLANNTLYVLGEDGQQQPTGTQGELYVGGAQVARGYLSLPDLTASKFIADPFKPHERLYRTGDLATLQADGNLSYGGRTDDQVKIRGYRIEPGEIERVAANSGYIQECVIIPDNYTQGNKRLVAFVIPKAGAYQQDKLRAYLVEKLPEYMVPQLIVKVDVFPLTSNGKIDKKALVIPDASELITTVYVAPKTNTEKNIAATWKTLLNVKRVGTQDNFFELGGTSLLAQKAVVELKAQHGYELPITKLYQYPNVSAVAKFIDNKTNKQTVQTQKPDQNRSMDIAVIGMAGRFPGADTISALWDVLAAGKETTTFFTDAEIDQHIPAYIKNDPAYVKARGIIKDAEYFDPAFFGINPKLAELMDPQQRIFLEIAWEVLEKTGHLPSKYPHKVGVFAGSGVNTYYENNVLTNPDLVENLGKMQVQSVNEKDYIASRTAYHINLKGPAVSVNAACSTALLAIAEAVTSLRFGQCDIALAGASSITSPINSGHIYQEGSMLSADGHCRAFDDEATGTVFSDGAGVVLLKTLANAEHDGDIIYGVIKGIGVNNDGYGKGSFTAPSSEGQAEAIASAIQDAGVDPADITFVEAHGTGTPIGDPIEIEGLVTAFGDRVENQYCAISSIKSNFGHLTQAAGVAGLIKACLSLHHKKLVPSVGFKTPNKHIDFANSPFYVNNVLKDWESDKKRVAGVSSFGVGGTNVHVILEEYENTVQESSTGRPAELLTWSANSEKSLDNYANALGNYIKENKAINLGDVSYSLQKSRNDFSHRRFIVAGSNTEAIDLLSATSASNTNNLKALPGEVVFTFPGQGAQYLNMGLDLYKHEAVYKAAVDECAKILHQYVDIDIRTIIYPQEISETANDNLRNTKYTQPALFVTEYALAKLWISWGITPTLFCGHSIGEYVAAHLAGVFSLEDGLKLIAMRGKMVSELLEGSMLSVREDVDIITALLPNSLSIAAVNSPKLCVIAGPDEDIADFSKLLDGKEIANKPLFTSHAFHSAMMDPVLPDFRKVVNEVKFSTPRIPIISTVTTHVLTDEEATSTNYWVDHLRNTVQFSKAIKTILDYDEPLFLEVGPGNVTSTLIKQIGSLKGCPSVKAIASLNNKDYEYTTILTALGQLWANGLTPNWNNFYAEQQRAFLELPSYQFDKHKYWVEPGNTSNYLAETGVKDNVFETTTALQNPHLQSEEVITNTASAFATRKSNLTLKVKKVLEDASGIEMAHVRSDIGFIEMGLDSLLLTQVAISLKRTFNLPITFRKLNEEYSTLDALVEYIEQNIAPEELPIAPTAPVNTGTPQFSSADAANSPLALITEQLQQLTKQVMLMQSGNSGPIANIAPVAKAAPVKQETTVLSNEEKTEIAKPFGATPKIERQSTSLDQKQLDFIANLSSAYNAKTLKSKEYAANSRPYMADPRVVSGFRPATKELVYPIVINRSEGSRLWDIDGNEYIDALNGFGSNMLGYQHEAVKKAMHSQIDTGYEVGPQHELAADVCKLVCEFTDFDRSALCSTGSEAVLGCIRIARTITGRPLIVAFTGSYHGIIDEVLVRGTKALKSFPAAAGIMPEAVQNILVLDYGTEETLAIIKERAGEIAAVLVEPIQSRKPEFVPVEFLKQLRTITEQSGSALIFDEVISGFRMHQRGAQGMFDIKADLASYGKVVGAGIPIGVIAGKKEYMDALDGGTWNYGDASFPEIGVTYFAGTFVRHPLALVSAKASLEYMKTQGPELQISLNKKGAYLSEKLNKEFEKRQLPMFVANFGSLWKVKYHEEIPYSELMFVLMRQKGIHILDGFPCFMTEAMSYQDIDKIFSCMVESMDEMIEAGFFPSLNAPNLAFNAKAIVNDVNNPPVKGAKLGKDKAGNPAWFIQHPTEEGKYLQVEVN